MSRLNSLLVRQLKKQRPTVSGDAGTFDVGLSTDTILSKIDYVLKLGIDSFDEITGCLPFGRIVELYGLEASGKTATVIRSLIMAQIGNIYRREYDRATKQVILTKLDPAEIEVATVFIDNEQSVDEDGRIKVDGSELDCIIARCDTVDQLFKMIDITVMKMAAAQKIEYKAAEDEKRTAKTILTVIVCDTIAGTSSAAEMKKDWNKDDYQRQPKALREGFRTMSRDINRHNILFIATNQVSEKFVKESRGKSFLPQEEDFSTFGGRALRYYASLRVFMFPVNKNYKVTGSRFSQGLLLGFFTAKNRVMKPLRTGRMVLLFNGGLNNFYSLLETMIYLGLVTYSQSTKRFMFRFSEFGIELTSFPRDEKPKKKSVGAQLEEDDDFGRSGPKNPEMGSRADWERFYQEHKPECDQLWLKAKEALFDDSLAPEAEEDDVLDLNEE